MSLFFVARLGAVRVQRMRELNLDCSNVSGVAENVMSNYKRGSSDITILCPARAQSIVFEALTMRRSTYQPPRLRTSVSVGSEAGSGGQRMLMRVEIRVAIRRRESDMAPL